MTDQTQLMTVDEFWALYADQPYELVRGKVVEVVPKVYAYESTASRVGRLLGSFVEAHDLGGDVVSAETGFRLSETTLRAPDVGFFSQAKLETITEDDCYLPFAPDLAVEVVSSDDSADSPADIQDKVALYLEAGTAILWIMYPDLQQVVVYRADQPAKTLARGGTLDGGDVLPGLTVRVSDVFSPVSDQE